MPKKTNRDKNELTNKKKTSEIPKPPRNISGILQFENLKKRIVDKIEHSQKNIKQFFGSKKPLCRVFGSKNISFLVFLGVSNSKPKEMSCSSLQG